jgi:4-amino-4-deoxy-L-arabinose transferase-like glycosyltransferase
VSEIHATTLRRVGWALLVAATLYLSYFSNLNVIGFVGPDEPRYAWIARDMAETGDWVTPRLYGRPWFEKPPLLYWGGAIFFKLMPGQPEIAARLPSAICALLATLALAWLAWRRYGEECARWLLLLLPTSVAMIGFSHACATDMPFAGMLTLSLVCAAVIVGLVPPSEDTPVLPRTPWRALLFFGFFLGLAVLAKGPAALALMGGAVFFWALFTKRWSGVFRLLHPAAIFAFCGTALPWYILCAHRNPDFFRIFIIEHNFKRYLTPEFQHIQPFWYYAPILLVAFFPWTALFATAALYGARGLLRFREANTAIGFVLCWVLFVVVFFSASKSKLPGYVLPAIPALALSVARAVARPKLVPPLQTALALLGTGLAIVAGSLLAGSYPDALVGRLAVEPRAFATLLLPLGIATFLAGLAPLVAVSWLGKTLMAASSSIIALSIAFSAGIVRHYHLDAVSARGLAAALNREVPSGEKLRVFGIRRGEHYALNFYLRREIPRWEDQPIREGYVLTEHKYCNSLNTEDSCKDLGRMRDVVTPGPALLRIEPRDSLGGIGSRQEPD